MRKFLIVLMFFALCSCLLAQKENFRVQQAYETGGSIYKYFQITGTGKDTSQTMDFYSTTVLKYWAGDQISADSVNLKVYVDHASNPPTSGDWVCDDTLTVTSDSTWIKVIYTSEERPSEPFMRIRIEGQSTNRKAGNVIFKFLTVGWKE